MNRNRIYSALVLSSCIALSASPGCAGDDAKIAVGDSGEGGEAGDAAADAGGAPASGGSQNSAGADSIGGGSSDGGANGDGGSAVAGSAATPSAGDANGGSGGVEANAGSGAGGGDAGTGSADEGTPVPSACVSCGSDFCVGPRVACQNDPECVSCRDDDYRTLACAQNSNFTSWINCLCGVGCTAACSAFCAG